MPTRTPGPHPDLESEPSAADPARVRDPPQPAPASPVAGRRCPAETATRTDRSRAVPRTKTGSLRWPNQRISPGRVTWMRFSAPTGRGHQFFELGIGGLDALAGERELGDQLSGEPAAGLANDVARADRGQQFFGLRGGQELLDRKSTR